MYDHIGLKVKDLKASVRFYSAALGSLGYVLCDEGEDSAAFGPDGQPGLYLYAAPDGPVGGTHVAFSAPSRKAVMGFHAAGIDAGGRDNGKPGPRPDYSDTYYAGFLFDLDGNNVEAVCYK